MTLGATRGSNRIQSKGHFGVIKVFIYCNSLSRANRVAFVLCCCGDVETESRDRERQRMIQWSRAHAHRKEHIEERRVTEWERVFEFQPELAVSAWTGHFDGFAGFGWYSPSQRELAQIGPSLSRVGVSRRKKKKTTWQTRLDAAPTCRQRRPSCVAPRRTRVRRL